MNFHPKHSAVSVLHQTVGTAIGRSKNAPMSYEDVVREMIARLNMPPSLRAWLRQRHGLDE